MTLTETLFPIFSLTNLTQAQRERLIELITEIRSEIQYLILIISNHPDAMVVQEVRNILALNREEKTK